MLPIAQSQNTKAAPAAFDAAAWEPIVRKIAGAAHRRMPANIELDDVLQVCRITAMTEAPKFNGTGNIEGFVAQRMQQRIIDMQRDNTPGKRSKNKPQMVDEEEAHGVAAADDVFATVAARQELAGLSGKAKAAAAAHLPPAPRKTSPNFDPTSAKLFMCQPVPAPQRKRVNRYRIMMDRMPATGHYELDPLVAQNLVHELKKARIRHCFRTLDSGLVGVWREPSAEQLKGTKKCQ